MRIISGWMDTRMNKEDFALTPYLFLVWVVNKDFKLYGLGICWGYFAFYSAIGFNIPKAYPSFKKLIPKNEPTN